MPSKSGHTVDTLKDLMESNDRRVEDRFKANDKAVDLAKQTADNARGTISFVAIGAVVAGITSILSVVISLAALFLHR